MRHAVLLDAGRPAEFCDRVSDALREYLGDSLGFDGLEQTTDEIAGHRARGAHPENERTRVLGILRECDLVKFAKFAPERAACEAMLDSAERHVRVTMPRKRADGSPRARPVPRRRPATTPSWRCDEAAALTDETPTADPSRRVTRREPRENRSRKRRCRRKPAAKGTDDDAPKADDDRGAS